MVKQQFETLGQRIKKLRKERKMTQEALARASNISYVSLVKIEQGKTKQPAFQTIYKIVKSLWTDLNSFAEGTIIEENEE